MVFKYTVKHNGKVYAPGTDVPVGEQPQPKVEKREEPKIEVKEEVKPKTAPKPKARPKKK